MKLKLFILASFLLVIAPCAQTKELKKEVMLSSFIYDLIETINLEAKPNPEFCSKLPTRYSKLEKIFTKNEGNEFFKLQAGVFTGFYRYAAVNNKCDLKFLEKNVTLLSFKQGKDYSGPGVFYFLEGELIGFQAALLKHESKLSFHEAFLMSAITLTYQNKKLGADDALIKNLLDLSMKLPKSIFDKTYLP